MGETEAWNRTRAAITCVTMPLSFLILMGWIDGEDLTLLYAGLIWMPIGAIIGLAVMFRTKVT